LTSINVNVKCEFIQNILTSTSNVECPGPMAYQHQCQYIPNTKYYFYFRFLFNWPSELLQLRLMLWRCWLGRRKASKV